MKRKRFSVEQIVAIMKQAEMGPPVAVDTEELDACLYSENQHFYWLPPRDSNPDMLIQSFTAIAADVLATPF